MTEEVLKAVEPMPNGSVIDLTDMSDSTPKKRKVEAFDRSSVAPPESSIPDKGVENAQKPAKRAKKTDEEKEAAKLLREQRLAQKEQKAAEKEAELKAKQAEKEQKAAEKEAEAKARQAEKEQKAAEKEAEAKAKQAEKDVKAAEKAQQNALKAEREKEKAEALEKAQRVKQKQANVMASFFGKKKESSASPVKALISRSSPAGPSRTESPERQPSPEKTGSDYERTFKGPILRPNARWAEVNPWFGREASVTSLTEREATSRNRDDAQEVQGWSSQDFIQDHLSRHRIRSSKRRKLPQGLKTAPPAASVGEVWAEYLKSDNPRAVLDQLKDVERYPWKTLSFHHENRPPYRGTWTKRSVCVGPRTPFGQDPTIDYAYDSDAEWVDDEGDNVDAGSVADEDEDEDGDDEDAESEGEFDDWLDDSKDAVKKKIAKRKFVEIVPSWSGPLWETKLGDGTPGMEDYRIRCLNDTPLHSIDPFTWVSEYPEQRYKAEYALFAADNGNNVKCLIKSKRIAGKKVTPKEEAEPTVPKPIDASAPVANGPTTGHIAQSVKSKAPAAPPPFPALYTPQFLDIVRGSTKSESELLSALKTALPFATKATLRAKLKETATKVGSKKDVKWVIKRARADGKPSSSDLPAASESL